MFHLEDVNALQNSDVYSTLNSVKKSKGSWRIYKEKKKANLFLKKLFQSCNTRGTIKNYDILYWCELLKDYGSSSATSSLFNNWCAINCQNNVSAIPSLCSVSHYVIGLFLTLNNSYTYLTIELHDLWSIIKKLVTYYSCYLQGFLSVKQI